jgi:DNA-binding transcriptional regulator YiaG
MPTEDELFAAVDALLQGEPQLPSPAERARLREAAGVPQARLAQALKTTTQTVKNWENGRSEPRPPRRQAYLRLLEGWAAKYPAEASAQASEPPETVTSPTSPVPAPPDRNGDGKPVLGNAAPCLLCGQPTPYRAAGQPQHLEGLCQVVAGPQVPSASNSVMTAEAATTPTETQIPRDRPASAAAPIAPSTPGRTAPTRSAPRRNREADTDLLARIAEAVEEQLGHHGGDMEQATAALVKRAIPDAMALLELSRVGSRYEYTAYPPLPEIVKKASRSGADQVWEARPKWRNRQLKRTGGRERAVTVLDMNGAYLAALKTHLPIGPLKHDPTGTWDTKTSGLYLVTPPTWEHEDLPNPIGNRDEPGPLWLTDPTVRLLQRLSGPKLGLCEPPVIHEAWTAHSTESILEKFRQALAVAREQAIEDDDPVTLEYVKAMYSKFVSTLGESGSNHQIRRPEWMHIIRSQAFTNLWLKGLKAHDAGLTLVQMAGTDELHVIGDWRTVFPEGRRISEVKQKDEYTIGGER